MAVTVGLERLESYRDRLWRRLPDLKVRDDKEATCFLETVPLCLAFGGYPLGVPSLWVAACGERDPLFPEHSHHDPAVGFVWQAKDTLVQAGSAYYGRLFLGKPSFVSRTWLATVLAAYPPKSLSPNAQAVVNALANAERLTTEAVGLRAGIHEKKTLTEALHETQIALKVTKVEERSDPFTYIWGTLDLLFEQEIAEAQRIPPESARRKMLAAWIRILGVAQTRKLKRILGWESPIVEAALAELLETGGIVGSVRIEGANGDHVADKAVLDSLFV